jgi:hypothetical protein
VQSAGDHREDAHRRAAGGAGDGARGVSTASRV